MRRTAQPRLEILEGKALLSGTTSGLVTSLTVTPAVAVVGNKVVMTFTETNTTDHDISTTDAPGYDGFDVSQGGKTVWISNPGAHPQIIILQTMKPGQTFKLQATWDGRSNAADPNDGVEQGPQLTGTFTVTNQHAGGATKATFSLLPPSTSTHVVPPKPPAHPTH